MHNTFCAFTMFVWIKLKYLWLNFWKHWDHSKCLNIISYFYFSVKTFLFIYICRVGSARYRCIVLYRLVTTGARYCPAWSLRPGPGWLVCVCMFWMFVSRIPNLISCILAGLVNGRAQTDSYMKFIKLKMWFLKDKTVMNTKRFQSNL